MKRLIMADFDHNQDHLDPRLSQDASKSNTAVVESNVVTPIPDKRFKSTAEDNRVVPFTQWSQIFRQNIVPKNFMSLGAEVSVIRTSSNLIALIEVNQGNDEAFLHPLIKLITSTDQPNEERSSLLKEVPVIAIAPRRVSKQDNVPIYKTTQGKTQYKKCYIVCFQPMGFTSHQCNRMAQCVATFLNNWRKSHPYQNPYGEQMTSSNSDHFITVPPDFDQTPPVPSALDWFLLDEDVLKITKLMIQTRHLHKQFYSLNEKIANALFSEPFPAIAMNELGYCENINN
jgi:hypothetical protein